MFYSNQLRKQHRSFAFTYLFTQPFKKKKVENNLIEKGEFEWSLPKFPSGKSTSKILN